MTEIQLDSYLYTDCPICGLSCRMEEVRGYNTPLYVQETCQQFLCMAPVAADPLHYYSHIIRKPAPEQIAYQEFSIDIGNRRVIFANDYLKNKTLIRNQKDEEPLELDFLLVPDFPKLTSLVKRIRTAIVFS